MNTSKKSDLNVFAFWKAQKSPWKVTVARVSLERLGYKMILPYLSLYVVLMGATKTQLGLVTSLGLVVAGLMGPFLGQHIDRHGPKKMYIFGICVLIAGYIAFAQAPIWQIAALGMFLHQMGQTLSGQSCSNICGNCLANCDRAKGMLVCETFAAGVLGMIGPMISAWVLLNFVKVVGTPTDPEQIRPLFYITLAFTAISLLIIVFKLDVHTWGTHQKKRHNIFKDGLAILKAEKNCIKWLGAKAVGNLPSALVIPYLQLYAAEIKGASTATLAAMTTAAALTSVLCGYFAGVLSDRLGRKKVLFTVVSLYAIGLIILITCSSPAALIIVGALTGFQEIGGTISASIQHELVPNRIRGRWSGVNSFTTSMVSAGMAAVSGLIYENMGPHWVFLIYILCELLIRLPLMLSIPETLSRPVDEEKFSALDA
ncbi:MAG: MFS transporter [Clostridiales bacterium]|nr:MFS transporter [Clostridiales bacterium]